MAEPLIPRHTTILVGTSLDDASAVALRRAVALARTFDANVRVLHAVPWKGGSLLVREEEQRIAIAEWAMNAAQIVLEPSHIACRLEEPATALARDAREHHASLVVLGASSSLAERLLRIAPLHVLIAQPPRQGKAVVAATDLRDKRFPVAHAAASWAESCAGHVTLVHNLEHLPTTRDASRRLIWPALRDLLLLTRCLAPIRRAHLSRGESTAAVITDLVREQSADLVVVGTRRAHGRMLPELLSSIPSSVLVVSLS